MATITYPHFPVTEPSLPRSKWDWPWALGRLLAAAIGAGAVAIQVTYTWATLPSDDWAQRGAPVLFAVALAASLLYVEHHFRKGQHAKAGAWLIAFGILLTANLATTVTRVSEVRALKSAAGEHIGDIQREAKNALRIALTNEDDAREQMRRFCEMTKTTTTRETSGKGKKARSTSTTDADVDPRCASWTTTLNTAIGQTNAARSKLADAAVVSSTTGVSPAAKSVSRLTGWDEVTVDHSMDFLQPVGLDVLALVAFLTAFSTKPRQHTQRPRKEKPSPQDADTMVKGLPQTELNALVASWIDDAGLPIGAGVGASMKLFMTWADLGEGTVTFVTFGRALTALGIERRNLDGRKVIAGRRAAVR